MDSSRHKLHYIAEATYGTCPATPALQILRHIGCTLALAKSMMVSEEIRADRNISDARHGTKQVGGDISGEISYGTYDDFIQAAMGGTWAAKVAALTASDISAAAADNSINSVAGAFGLYDVGDKLTISGFTGTAGNNQSGVVVSRTASKIVLTTAVALVNDAAGEAVTITCNTQTVAIGTTRRSFALLRYFSDQVVALDYPYHLYTGQEVNNLQFSFGVDKIIGIVLGILGKQQNATSDTAPAGSTYVAVNTNKVMDAFTGSLYEGGSLIATITELALTLENGLSPKFTLATDATRLPSIGRANATGQLTAYAENATLLNKFINQTESSLKVLLSDAAGNGYRINCPRIKYTGGQMDTKGQGPITIPAPFQCLLDSTSGTSLSIDRIPA